MLSEFLGRISCHVFIFFNKTFTSFLLHKGLSKFLLFIVLTIFFLFFCFGTFITLKIKSELNFCHKILENFKNFIVLYWYKYFTDPEECNIRCPSDIVTSAEVGVEFVQVRWEQPSTMCSYIVSSSPLPGSFFVTGPTPVTVMLLNNSGAVADQCSFTVDVRSGK